MRVKKEGQLPLPFGSVSDRRIVEQFQEKYNRISGILDRNPAILDLADRDLKTLSQGGTEGRDSHYTSENILRALVVLCVEELPFRDTIVRIADSHVLWNFVRLGHRDVMDFTFLNKCYGAIQPETWTEINAVLSRRAVKEGRIDPSTIRTDTTVVEGNIHYPTDSSLLWDSWRVLVRWIRRAKEVVPEVRSCRFHDRKVKGLHLYITRYISSRAKGRKREVRRRFRKLIQSVRRVVEIAERVCRVSEGGPSVELAGIALELKYFLPAAKTVADAAERVAVKGESVPARDRVFSVFEQHVELIKRGKRSKPVEFGHKVLLTQTREKFISDYAVMAKQVPDTELLEQVVEGHRGLYGAYPDVVTADKGFRAEAEAMSLLGEKVDVLAVPRRATDWGNEHLSPWQAFRAGIEGSISVLKRAFGLLRCLFRGFKNFASSVGLGVFCHNLVCLARA